MSSHTKTKRPTPCKTRYKDESLKREHATYSADNRFAWLSALTGISVRRLAFSRRLFR